ncbi:MAG: NAD-dependent deacylase [Myxococcota bacterium]
MSDVTTLARWIDQARHVVALTGAGVSTESGIPDFRSAAGLWSQSDPMDVASIDGFRADPGRFYRFWAEKFAAFVDAPPSRAHRLLAGLEGRGRMQAIVTQNIDGLHQRAGSRNVLEVHGTFQRVRCLSCGNEESLGEVFGRVVMEEGAAPPSCPVCGHTMLKPDVVLFGEMLPPIFQVAERESRDADLFLVLGTSLEVFPVAGLAPLAKRTGARVVILNRDPTPYDREADLVLQGELGAISRELTSLLGLGA